MQIESFSIPAIQRRNDKRLAIHAKSDVSEKARVQNVVNRLPVVRPSIGDAAEFSALCQIHLAPAFVSRSNLLPKSCLHHPSTTVQNGANSWWCSTKINRTRTALPFQVS